MNKKALEVEIDDFFGDITFKTKDGRKAFIIYIRDGHTIEITGGEVTKDDDVLYGSIFVMPNDNNSITVSKLKYE